MLNQTFDFFGTPSMLCDHLEVFNATMIYSASRYYTFPLFTSKKIVCFTRPFQEQNKTIVANVSKLKVQIRALHTIPPLYEAQRNHLVQFS